MGRTLLLKPPMYAELEIPGWLNPAGTILLGAVSSNMGNTIRGVAEDGTLVALLGRACSRLGGVSWLHDLRGKGLMRLE